MAPTDIDRSPADVPAPRVISVVTYRPWGIIGQVLFAAPFLFIGCALLVASCNTVLDGRIGAAMFVLLLAFLFALGGWSSPQRASIEVDWDAATLAMVRTRWPWAEKRRIFALGSVSDAVVRSGARSGSSVEIVVADEEKPVFFAGSSADKYNNAFAEQVRSLLRRAEAMRAGGTLVELEESLDDPAGPPS